MLTRVKLKNFRAFSEEIDVRIRPITVLIGRNSAGKSTLIKFLLMLQQTLEASEGEFFSTEGRHVSLGTFSDLKNSTCRTKSFQFTLELKTTDLPEPNIQKIRDDLQRSILTDSLTGNTTELRVQLQTASTVVGQDSLEQKIAIKSTSDIPLEEAIADFSISGSIPYGKGTNAKHSVIGKIGEKKFKKEDLNIRRGRTRFLSFPFPNNPVDILKSAFDNSYFDGIRHELLSMRHLSPVREESERTVILGSPPPDDVGHRGEYAMPHLQKLLEEDGERAEFILKHIEAVVDVKDLEFKPQAKGFVPEFRAKNKITGAKAYLADFGFGVSQCIPIFVQGALLNSGQLLIVEQPEAQIHPSSQLEMGSFFAELWKKRRVPSLIETHSENIILRLRKLIARGDLEPEDVGVSYFHVEENESDDNVVRVTNLSIDSKGVLEEGLPMSFFGADVMEALGIRPEAQ